MPRSAEPPLIMASPMPWASAAAAIRSMVPAPNVSSMAAAPSITSMPTSTTRVMTSGVQMIARMNHFSRSRPISCRPQMMTARIKPIQTLVHSPDSQSPALIQLSPPPT